MSNQDENPNNSDQPSSSTDTDEPVDELAGNFKTLLLSIGGVAVVLSILVLLPMLLTYISEGDVRAPAEIHPTDSARKSGENAYNVTKPDH
jgi:Na+-transporting methylmalonyl-CoA/oxaloacetate decarboxylase gamma subunit